MKRVLLVEDEELLSNLVERKLQETGYEVILAQDGEKGLELLRAERPDLVLLDIVLPKMSGLELMEAKNKEEEIRDIPVVVVSNSGQPVEINQIRELGAKDWLVKTNFDPAEVIEKVKKQIGV